MCMSVPVVYSLLIACQLIGLQVIECLGSALNAKSRMQWSLHRQSLFWHKPPLDFLNEVTFSLASISMCKSGNAVITCHTQLLLRQMKPSNIQINQLSSHARCCVFEEKSKQTTFNCTCRQANQDSGHCVGFRYCTAAFNLTIYKIKQINKKGTKIINCNQTASCTSLQYQLY